jgi:DNA-binding protein HU-beta
VNKTELINSLGEETSFSKKDIGRVLDSFMRILERTLRKGDKLQWSGFGTFKLNRRPERKGINPLTRQEIQIPSSWVLKFVPSKFMRELGKSIR